ncbi:hypothetical protein [Alteromonas sp. H39]|uniref:hypothetical protein n=1 Tax=Alteromonas sp. H39 TaxID=3389876 RepID=UPI0039E1D264
MNNRDPQNGKSNAVSQEARRKFIYKSATGAALVAVPGKSVWGACSVSGAMSGNVSSMSRHTCEIPSFSGGRSPGTWKDGHISLKAHAVFDALAENNAVPQSKADKGSPMYNCYVNHVNLFISSTSMQIDPRLLAGSLATLADSNGNISLFDALESNGGGDGSLEFNLAGVFCNAYFGFYENIVTHNAAEADRLAAANKLVNDIVIYLVTMAKTQPDVSIDFGFLDEASTPYVVDECSLMSRDATEESDSGNDKPKKDK